MTRHTVTIRIDGEHDDAFEAANGAYRMLSSLLASPMHGVPSPHLGIPEPTSL